MIENRRHRYRIHFAKEDIIRFTGHLDLYRTWERTLRRARVPLAYSQGFNPRPKINQSPALPLGCTSECEAIDIWLEEERSPEQILHDLRQVTPQGLRTQSIQEVDLRAPSLQSQVVAVMYDVSLDPPPSYEDLQRSVQMTLRAKSLPRTRRGRDYDLRPLIEKLELDRGELGITKLRMILSSREGATGRPEEVIASLGMDPTFASIHRTRLILGTE
jgi:radical SAM-linked protein